MPIDEKTGELTGDELEEVAARSFGVFMGKIAEGDLELQASQELLALSKCIDAQARAQQKEVKGSLTITIKLAGDETGAVDVTYAIERKEPKPRRARSTFWIDRKGQIVSKNPKQIELGLRDVSKKQPARDVGARAE